MSLNQFARETEDMSVPKIIYTDGNLDGRSFVIGSTDVFNNCKYKYYSDEHIENELSKVRSKTIEECALAVEMQDKKGIEFVKNSLWESLLKRASRKIRLLDT